MKNNIYIVFLLCFSAFSFAQNRYLTKSGTVEFEASVPSFEEVKAKNENTTAILNSDNGEFAALVLVKGFRFKNALMEEHFNENYAESDTYPKATFKGSIADFNFNALSSSAITVSYSGNLEFHGKTKVLDNETFMISKVDDDTIHITGNFKVDVDDFNIEIPKIVSNKLSREVLVTLEFDLNKK